MESPGLLESPRERRRRERKSSHENVDLRHYAVSRSLHEESSDVNTTINPLCLLYIFHVFYKLSIQVNLIRLLSKLIIHNNYTLCARG